MRVDLDPSVRPDVVASLTDLEGVADASVDAVFSSHNLEHVYAHEVPEALAQFRRVLKEGGFALVTTPDLEAVARAIVKNGLDEKLYDSPAGPVAPLDVIYGHRPSVRTSEFMAHRTGFSKRTLLRAMAQAFPAAACGYGRSWDLWALGLVKAAPGEAEAMLKEIALQLTPARA